MGGWLGGMGGWLGRKTWHFFRFLARRKRPRQKSKKMLKKFRRNFGGNSAEFWMNFGAKINVIAMFLRSYVFGLAVNQITQMMVW